MSDHFSGPRAIAGPAGDICDFYVFPSPSQQERIVLVMTVHPDAKPDTTFSDAITFRFRMRPVTIPDEATHLAVGTETEEITFDISFDRPAPGDGSTTVQIGRCVAMSGEPVSVTVNDISGVHTDALSFYAGLRSDPFFIDQPAFAKSMMSGQLAFSDPGTNSLVGADVLGIVVEADCAPLRSGGQGPVFAVAAETVVSGPLPIRLERTGRPEVKNVMLSPKAYDSVNSDMELRDLYNLEDPFHMGKDYRGAYRARLNANLPVIDRLDGKEDWQTTEEGDHPLTELLLGDYLVIDVSKPFSDSGFFEIEQSMLAGRPHTTCGGRSLNDDVMDKIYTLLITAGQGPPISDGVRAATTPAGTDFPYLAPANQPLAGH
ncbi:DUF4331 family protein [Modestobacter marinus]|uniref:DUF4331 family protein n=1 Tax=Modestobacter marinus TaxID=477641 RepID=UPI001C94F757|nr:DUF4331 family protein [Modestobacter marinus]